MTLEERANLCVELTGITLRLAQAMAVQERPDRAAWVRAAVRQAITELQVVIERLTAEGLAS